ncbi:thymidine phosphorylase [Thalassotalea ponticola]|uniref:thymidine phosphorylase n=1 Tax=Thalassotalea ponticola TaxID=1523392 RepID=UPI0025B4C03B|nr:thymidine phosphorylase [Thalassotalea ponticola]MDN3652485.1 thymidine phosphorylase [Thalassotalea ponticola]
MFIPQEIIRDKRDGNSLSKEQIDAFVDGLAHGSFNDAQVGAMAMAIILKGMNVEETVNLTLAMKDSGHSFNWDHLNGPVVDKHSTGGVGDKVSFMLASIVAANGGYVPMISGRGLGHTGGTVDKLESIPGFDVQPSEEKFKQLVKDVGVAIIGQTSNIAPADKRLYGIRDITATVDSIPLITASILSKKLAAGLDTLVMDVKVGNGAMMQNMDEAVALANSIVSVANGAGVTTKALITDMNQVLGLSAGNALEIVETLDYLSGKYREARLHNIVTELAVVMLLDGKLAKHKEQALDMVEQVLDNGKAAEVFANMISAMGGPAHLFERHQAYLPKANVIADVTSDEDGVISSMQTRDIGMLVVGLGGGRISNDQSVDHSVGFDQILPIGAKVSKGDVLARVHAKDEDDAKAFAQKYRQAIKVSASVDELNPTVYKVIG